MLLATATSLDGDPGAAAVEIAGQLEAALPGAPHLVVLFTTEAMSPAASALAARLPGSALFGGTTCRGVITETGIHLGETVTAALALHDPDGAYAAAAAAIGTDAHSAARQALEAALEVAGRPYESPGLIWTCQPPGTEEAVLTGYADVVGPACPIMGGSSADEAIAGNWSQFSQAGEHTDCVSTAALFPSRPPGLAFASGYAPTGVSGRATRTQGRRLLEIDGRPAATVYAEWTGGLIDPARPGPVLQQSTPAPIARKVGAYAGIDEYLLSHPAAIEADGALVLFTDIADGEMLYGMRGDLESLIARAGRVAAEACAATEAPGTLGGLVIYCGGCMLAVSDRLGEVANGLRAAFGEAPFLTAFTFGEQGALVSSGNRHGNLMIAAAAFGHG